MAFVLFPKQGAPEVPAPTSTALEPAAAGLTVTIPMTTAGFAHDLSKPGKKPLRLQTDIWQILQEYGETGGLLNVSEEIAALQQLEKEIRESTMPLDEKHKEVARVIKMRADTKLKHQKMQIAGKQFITQDMFLHFMDELFANLKAEVNDASLLQRIGVRLARMAKSMKLRQA